MQTKTLLFLEYYSTFCSWARFRRRTRRGCIRCASCKA